MHSAHITLGCCRRYRGASYPGLTLRKFDSLTSKETQVFTSREPASLTSRTDLASNTIATQGACSRSDNTASQPQDSSLLLLLPSRFSRVRLCATPETAAHQVPRPWDSPGKNTGVGCHFLLQCMKVKSESELTQSCPTLRDPVGCSPPGSSVHWIFQARVLEWGAIAFSICLLNSSK